LKTKLSFTPQSRDDIAEIHRYISDELGSPVAAETTIRKIMEHINKLRDFPDMGASLKNRLGVKTEYRFLVCENYLAFYKHEGDGIHIYSILYSKRDPWNVLF
jgi:toxin ParE1/3/4